MVRRWGSGSLEIIGTSFFDDPVVDHCLSVLCLHMSIMIMTLLQSPFQPYDCYDELSHDNGAIPSCAPAYYAHAYMVHRSHASWPHCMQYCKWHLVDG